MLCYICDVAHDVRGITLRRSSTATLTITMQLNSSFRVPANRAWFLFVQARRYVDALPEAASKEDRPVEHEIFPKPEPKRNAHVGSACLPLRPKNALAQHWQDVLELTAILDADGTLFGDGGKLRSAQAIARELLLGGTTWATAKKVRQAQRRLAKRRKAAES